MAICGHQFYGGDESDWALRSSASCLDGSTTANEILQELFKKHYRSMPSKTPRKRPKTVVVASKNTSVSKPNAETNDAKRNTSSKGENENLIIKKITRAFENFDESQHLNGCPVKWLYNKKLLEKNKTYKTERLYNKKSIRKEEVKRERSKNLRDKTPIEVKIHKINLVEKYTSNSDDIYAPYGFSQFSSEKTEKDSKDLETRRKKLAAKLNWKMYDDSRDDYSFETSPGISSRHNYLPPRPLLGLKPLLSVLLAPHQETNCCSLVTFQDPSQKTKSVAASLSVRSVSLSFPMPESTPRPRMTNALRWGSKSSFLSKKLQIPNQITIKLDQHHKELVPDMENHLKVFNCSPPGKRASGRTKQTKSLSSLFYELKDKTNYRNQNGKYFEEMIRDLTMKEGQFKIKRFLSISSANSDLMQGNKSNTGKREKSFEMSSGDSELNLVCEKVRFFSKRSLRKQF